MIEKVDFLSCICYYLFVVDEKDNFLVLIWLKVVYGYFVVVCCCMLIDMFVIVVFGKVL